MDAKRELSSIDLAALVRELGRYGDAARCFLHALRRMPRTAEIWHRLGVCLLLLRKDSDARQAFERAVRLDPTHSSARFNLATLLRHAAPGRARQHLFVLRGQDPDLATLLEGQLDAWREG